MEKTSRKIKVYIEHCACSPKTRRVRTILGLDELEELDLRLVVSELLDLEFPGTGCV